MARIKINPGQLQKLDLHNGVDTKAINLTSSTAWSQTVIDTDVMIIQSGSSDAAKKVAVSDLQDYFGKPDVVDSADTDFNFEVLFVSGAGDQRELYVDDSTLTYNPNDAKFSGSHFAAGTGSFARGTISLGTATTGHILQVTGAAGISGAISGSSTLHAGGIVTFGNGDFTVAANGNVDINGGAIDGTAIGASSQSTIKATTVSGSSTLNVGTGANIANSVFQVSSAGALEVGNSISGSSTLNIGSSAAFANSVVQATTSGLTSTGVVSGSGNLSAGGDLSVNGDATIHGSLSVIGTTVTLDTTNLAIEDNVIELNRGSGSAGTRATNASAGIKILGSEPGKDITLAAAADGGRLKATAGTGSAAGFDIVSGGTYAIDGTEILSAAALTVGSAAMSEADLEQLDDLTAGTVTASKAVVVSSDKDISAFRHVTASAFSGSASDSSVHGLIADRLTANSSISLAGATQVTVDADNDSIYLLDATDSLVRRDNVTDVVKAGYNRSAVQLLFTSGNSTFVNSSAHILSGAAPAGGDVNVTSSAFDFTDDFSSTIVTASFEVYLNGQLQVRSGSVADKNISSFDYFVTASSANGSTNRVVFENLDSGLLVESDDIVVIKYVTK